VVVGVCRLTVLVPYAHSLKEKRSAVRKIKDRVQGRFGIPIAEVGGLDTWQRAVVGFAVVSSERGHIDSMLEKVVSFIDGLGVGELSSDERDVQSYGGDDR
jgi:uncharacterized protein YlxP (DUF503 family)